MNERIKLLAKQADIKFSAHWQHQGIDTAVALSITVWGQTIAQYAYRAMNSNNQNVNFRSRF